MQLNISCHNLDITEVIKEYSLNKLSKIKHHFNHIITVNMILEVEKGAQIAEARIHVQGADLFAKAKSDNMYNSIDKMVSKLTSQVKKHKEKLNKYR